MISSTRILVIDDDQEVLDLVVEVLRDGGFEVDGVKSVDAGLELFDPLRYSLVISDLQMHGRDGFDLLRSIRKQTKDVPIILLTGAGTIQTAVDAIKNGAFDFVTKPMGNATSFGIGNSRNRFSAITNGKR
jgi:two-component system response regulator AtoC